jgi:hypothetical protein
MIQHQIQCKGVKGVRGFIVYDDSEGLGEMSVIGGVGASM